MPIAGGNWNNTSNAGVFNLNLNNPRTNSNTNIGFRSALPSLPDTACSRMRRQCIRRKRSLPPRFGTKRKTQRRVRYIRRASCGDKQNGMAPWNPQIVRKEQRRKLKNMAKIKDVFGEIFSMENLYGALEDASRGRRYEPQVLKFWDDYWQNLTDLRNECMAETYEIKKYYTFYVMEPKKRLIMSIPFRDRVIQWAIYRIINPTFVKGYIEDSYGCIPGRGSLRAVLCLKQWMERYVPKGYNMALKLDVSKYFYRISHSVLKKIIRKKIRDRKLRSILFRVIDSKAMAFGLPDGMKPEDVPPEDRISTVGMPIGNLLSQMFANMYLDELDQFAKQTLRIRFYVRYMDDVIILWSSKDQLREWKDRIEDFLNQELELKLNRKTAIIPAQKGVEFVGYIVSPAHLYLRKSTTKRMKRSIRGVCENYASGTMTAEKARETMQSFVGMLDHTDSKKIKKNILDMMVLHRDYQSDAEV